MLFTKAKDLMFFSSSFFIRSLTVYGALQRVADNQQTQHIHPSYNTLYKRNNGRRKTPDPSEIAPFKLGARTRSSIIFAAATIRMRTLFRDERSLNPRAKSLPTSSSTSIPSTNPLIDQIPRKSMKTKCSHVFEHLGILLPIAFPSRIFKPWVLP